MAPKKVHDAKSKIERKTKRVLMNTLAFTTHNVNNDAKSNPIAIVAVVTLESCAI